jgi:hypothetical protein
MKILEYIGLFIMFIGLLILIGIDLIFGLPKYGSI